MTYVQMVVIFGFGLFFSGVGVVALLWPDKMQRDVLKHGTKFYFWPNPFLGWMRTRSYLVYLRIMGGVFVAAGLFVLCAALGSLLPRVVWFLMTHH
jgi:hypothetical protein